MKYIAIMTWEPIHFWSTSKQKAKLYLLFCYCSTALSFAIQVDFKTAQELKRAGFEIPDYYYYCTCTLI